MDIYNLLNINSEKFKDFYLLANNVIGIQEERVLNSNITKLKRIEDNTLTDKCLNVEPKSIEDVIKKVIRMSKKNDYSSDNWNFFELRIVSYYLIKLRGHHDGYLYALNLLDKNWKDLFFNGLVFYLMNSWHSIESEYKEKTSKLLVSKLQNYKGRNKRYNLFKSNANLFESAGPIRMSALLAQKGFKLTDAPTLLGFKSSSLKQQYYSDVIIRHIKNQRIKDLDYIEEIFELNDLDRTKKLVLAHMVDLENNNPDAIFRTKLCRFANRILGDITLSTSWAPFIGATQEDADILLRAKRLVNTWFTQKTIETFFEICVQDKDRKNFWLKYVDYIDAFKIVGSMSVKRNLMTSNKLGAMLMKQFIETNSQVSQTSALVLFIKDKMMVEFSDVGALYVYELNHYMVNFVRKQNINSTNDLKDTGIGQLMESGYYYSYGRMAHQGYWENRLSQWMGSEVLNKKVKRFSFSNENEKDIFKAIPLEKVSITEQPKDAINLKNVDESTSLNSPKKVTVLENTQKGTSINNPTKVNALNNIKESGLVKTIETVIVPQNTVFTGKKLSGIRYNARSKIIEENMIVANEVGFYICNLRRHQYVLLKEMDKRDKPSGQIWLKKTNLDDWKEITYVYMGEEKSIGFIKIKHFTFVFKVNLNSSERFKTTF